MMRIAKMWSAVWAVGLTLAGGLAVHASSQSKASAEEAFVGAWRLASFESFGADGDTTQRAMTGSIVYSASGHMAAQLMPDGYADRPVAEDGSADRSGYVAYWGPFSLDDVSADGRTGRVTHHVRGSLFPQWVGRGLVRYFEIHGDVLKLSLRNDEGRTTGTLTWHRE